MRSDMTIWQRAAWKAVPSANIHFPRDGFLVTWSVIADLPVPVLLLTGLNELLAKYLANSHNLLLSKQQ